MYDPEFWLYTNSHAVTSKKDYIAAYPGILSLGAPFATGGFTEFFVDKWFDARVKQGAIVRRKQWSKEVFVFADEFVAALRERLKDPQKASGKKKATKAKPAKKAPKPKKKAKK